MGLIHQANKLRLRRPRLPLWCCDSAWCHTDTLLHWFGITWERACAKHDDYILGEIQWTIPKKPSN